MSSHWPEYCSYHSVKKPNYIMQKLEEVGVNIYMKCDYMPAHYRSSVINLTILAKSTGCTVNLLIKITN